MSQVVKKEIITLQISDFCVLMRDKMMNKKKLSKKTNNVWDILTKGVYYAHQSYLFGFDIKKKYNLSFLQLSEISFVFSLNQISIEQVRSAAQELEEKGYLFRDTDGCLAFTPTGSVQ